MSLPVALPAPLPVDADADADADAVRAYADGPAGTAVPALVAALRRGLGARRAAVVLWFAGSRHRPEDVAGPLAAAFEGASVIGCSTAGEFTDTVYGTDGLAALALPAGLVVRHAAGLAELADDAAAGTDRALADLAARVGRPLRDLDPDSWVGLALLDGTHGVEEEVNERIGNAAPLLDVVGGSAGSTSGRSSAAGDASRPTGAPDAAAETWVAVGDQVSWHGAALVLLESTVPFRVVKTASAHGTGTVLRVTGVDRSSRTVTSFDGRPAVEAYAAAVGLPVERVDERVLRAHPVGLMVDGVPFIRSPRALGADGSMAFYCQVLPDSEVEVLRTGALVEDTAGALHRVADDLGGTSAAVLFNCILRRREIDDRGQPADFLAAISGTPTAGFHTFGESWMGHMNQTLTGVVFGQPRR